MDVVAMATQIDGPSHCSDGATDDQVLGVFFDCDVLAAHLIGNVVLIIAKNNSARTSTAAQDTTDDLLIALV